MAFDPKSLLIFTETTWFSRDWTDLGLNDESDLAALQLSIMLSPAGHPVIRGTGGLRKMRFSPPSWRRGKSSALRVCYSYYQEFGHVLLVVVYPKSVQDDLSAEERTMCKLLLEEHFRLLSQIYDE